MNQKWRQLILLSTFIWMIVVLLHTVDIASTLFLITSTVIFLTIVNAFLKTNTFNRDAFLNETDSKLLKWTNYLAIIDVVAILVAFDVAAFFAYLFTLIVIVYLRESCKHTKHNDYSEANHKSQYYHNEEKPLPDAYTTIGCRKSDSDQAIKRKYRALVKKYHPDYNEGNGDFLTKKIQEINQAYEDIKKERDGHL